MILKVQEFNQIQYESNNNDGIFNTRCSRQLRYKE